MKSIVRKLLLAVVLVSFVKTIHAQCPVASPQPSCIAVDPVTGDVTVTYEKSPGVPFTPPNEGFDYYELQHSLNQLGPFDSVAGAANINTLTMTHTGVDHSAVHFYRIISHSMCEDLANPGTFLPSEAAPSIVFNTIKISTVVTEDTVISLTWNQTGLGDPSSPVGYEVFREYPVVSASSLRASGINYGSEAYTDYIHDCNSQSVYIVKLQNPTGGCVNTSAPDTVDITDNTPPALQPVDSVSFNHFFNQPIIGWRSNAHKDVVSYVIVECIGGTSGGYNYLDTVPAGVHSFRDTGYIEGEPIQYAVYAIDQCGNVSTAFGVDCHNTILLSYEVDICEETVELLWNPYDDFNSGVNVVYQVYMSQGGAPAKLIGTTPDTRFLHEDPVTDTKVKYYVRAVENGGAGPFTTASNYVELETAFLRPPAFSYLRRVTVLDVNEIKTELYIDVDSDVKEYRIKRSTDTLLDDFVTIGTIRLPSVPVPADSMAVFRDLTASTGLSKYYYLYETLDSCGRVLDISNIASSIRLEVSPDHAAKTNLLVWNNYEGWEGNVFGYRVYRGQDGVMGTQPVVTVFPLPGEKTEYEDDISELTNGAEGQFCYYVQAIEDEPTFPRLEPATSESNIACVNHQPIIHIPNAFTPDGVNPVFKPVFVFTDVDNYTLSIFSRSGELVFETSNVNAGWDGKLDGDPLPTGIYIYQIKYRAVTGQKFQERGTLTLLR